MYHVYTLKNHSEFSKTLVAETKDYDEINCLLIRDKADWIKSQLDFSPKQAQRFDRFYTKCKKLLKEKRKEEVY